MSEALFSRAGAAQDSIGIKHKRGDIREAQERERQMYFGVPTLRACLACLCPGIAPLYARRPGACRTAVARKVRGAGSTLGRAVQSLRVGAVSCGPLPRQIATSLHASSFAVSKH